MWYFIAVALLMAGPTVGALYGFASWKDVRETPVTPISGPIDAKDKQIVVFSDLKQGNRTIVCTQRDAGKPESTPSPISGTGPAMTVEHDGSEWHFIAKTYEPPASAEIACAPKDARADNATYGYVAVDGLDTVVPEVILWLIVLSGIGLAVVVLVRRTRFARGI